MNRCFVALATIIVTGIVAFGCSPGHNAGGPVIPSDNPSVTALQPHSQESPTCLWAYYDVELDIEHQTATVSPNRAAMFTLNVVQFLNNNPANISFHINGTHSGAGYMDVDLDVSLKHPMVGKVKYRAYDVRGVFIGNGSRTLAFNNHLKYAVPGVDQLMLPDPNDGLGGPDGYTRWFNQPEFTTPGMFGYTPGVDATKGYLSTSTLNPYKYFADLLGTTDDAWSFLNKTAGHGAFSAGYTNTRNYYLRFPMPSPGTSFGYAVLANWGGVWPLTPPSNAPEPIAAKISMTSAPYYVDETHNGGTLGFDVSLFDWTQQPSTIFVESTVLKNVYKFTASDITPIETNDRWSRYHVEIPADNVTGVENQELWVIPENDAFDYSNPSGVPNATGTDKLTAFFRHDLTITPQAFNPVDVTPPYLSINPTAIRVAGNYGLVAAGYGGLFIFDITDPLNPVQLAWVDLPGYADAVDYANGYAYVAADFAGLYIVDVTPPSSAHLVNTVDTPGQAWGVAYSNGCAYVADASKGLEIIDVDPPASASIVMTVDTPGHAQGVAYGNGYAYVADFHAGLQIIDVDPPSSAHIVSTVATTGAYGVCYSSGYAYVADGDSGLRIIDVDPPDAAHIVGSVDTPGSANGVALFNGYAIVADGPSGLQFVDVDPPQFASILKGLDTPSSATAIAYSNFYAYVADWEDGLRIVKLW